MCSLLFLIAESGKVLITEVDTISFSKHLSLIVLLAIGVLSRVAKPQSFDSHHIKKHNSCFIYQDQVC